MRSIDGVLPKPARQPYPAQPAISRQTAPNAVKPHLQIHPLLKRHYDMDVRPAGQAPTHAPAQPKLQTARLQPQRQHSAHRPIAPLSSAPHRQQPQPTILQTAQAELPPVAQDLGKRTVFDRLGDSIERLHLSKLAVVGIVMAALLTGLSLFSLQLGQIVLGIYAVIAIWKKLASRLSFMLALMTFGGIIVTQTLSPDSGIADNLAVYAFLLLCIGTVSLAREVRQGGRQQQAATVSQSPNGGSLSKSL